MSLSAGSLAKRAVPYWAVLVTGWYVWSLKIWFMPKIVKWGLPWFGASSAPHLGFFLVRTAGFAAALAVLAAVGAGAGRAVGRWMRLAGGTTSRDLVVGWGAVAVGILGLGLAGCWFTPVMAAVVVPAAAWGVVVLVRRQAWRTGLAPLWRVREFAWPAALLGWLLLLICLAPEVFQDAMRYHLFLPRQFLLAHKFVFVERYFFWSYMGTQHMLNAAALALGGDLAARAVNVALGLGTILAMARIGRIAGLGGADLGLALGLVVAAPGLMLITASAFGEHGCWLPVMLTVEAAMTPRGGRPARLRECTILLALAFSAKYTALFGLAGMAALTAVRADRGAWWESLRRRTGTLLVIFVIPLAAWAGVRWLWTGDPFSPYLAKFGFHTLDSSSRFELKAYYQFMGEIQRAWLAKPDTLLWVPVNFMGAHGGFWEHPGPAIAALALPAVLYFDSLAPAVRMLAAFAAGSAVIWFTVFGGISPHYVMGLAGLWTTGLVGVLGTLPAAHRMVVRNVLACTVFVAALLSFIAGTFRFGPRDVAFGIVSTDYYLRYGLPPRQVNFPLRQELERVAPHRGRVYVLGDDTSYYLAGRVFNDYENGSDPLLWRIARESPGPVRMRIRLRQRGFTHMIYSTRWPDENAAANDEKMRFGPATARRVEAFWRAYARPVAVREADSREGLHGGYAFEFLRAPRREPYDATFSRRLPFLPGAGVLTWAGDRALGEGKAGNAADAYLGWSRSFGGLAILEDRLARVAELEGRRAEAADRRRSARTAGWIVDRRMMELR